MSPGEIDITRDGWAILHDPDDRGLAESWPRHAPAAGWMPTSAGRAWQHTLGVDAKGVAWYRRKVCIPESWRAPGMRAWLRFESVATDCRAWLNGVEVGRHVGDYLPFQFEITDAAAATLAAEEDAELVVRVDQMHAPRPAAGVLTENGHITKGFHDVLSLQHGGIWGGVSLRRSGRATVVPNGLSAMGDPERKLVRIRAEFDGDTRGLTMSFHIEDSEERVCAMGSVVLNGEREWTGDLKIGARGAAAIWTPDDPQSMEINLAEAAPDQDLRESLAEQAEVALWSPDSPEMHTLVLDVVTPNEVNAGGEPRGEKFIEAHRLRVGFRSVTTGGPDNRNILLNGRPILIRGVLHWGHEPEHIAPAPTPEQVRAEFARLKEMGFNCVCLCMWYAPEWFYDIADEMGMLIWQEHPVWKSPMEEEHIPEYKRLFEGFFRRDRRHPSVVIVSGSCEHERFHPELAKWWWERAKQELPGTLKQVQTAFLAWTNPEQTDLHDEHVYESGGRWVAYLEDLQKALAKLPRKPFVMGETIIGTSWLGEAPGESGRAAEQQSSTSEKARPWWFPKGYDECRAFEKWIEGRYGERTRKRFVEQADFFNVAQRRFQSEVLRCYPNHAGWVMNQIRDVPPARLGFMDDWGRWRLGPHDTLGWLGERALLLRTPDHRRGFVGGRTLLCEAGVSNFGSEPFDGTITFKHFAIGGATPGPGPLRDIGRLRCEPGDVRFLPLPVDVPRVERLGRMYIGVEAPVMAKRGWEIYIFPDPGDVPEGVVRLDGIEFSKKDKEPDFEERAYSSGWGLTCETWRPVLPDPSIVLFKCPLWRFDAPLPNGTRVIVTHKLTRSVVEFMEGGGRVILLASKAAGGPGTKYFTTWAQSPLVIEGDPLPVTRRRSEELERQNRSGKPDRVPVEIVEDAQRRLLEMSRASADPPYPPGDNWPIANHDSRWIVDLLHHDLTRRYTRAIPVKELGIIDQVDPIVRLVFTHDSGVPRPMDAVFAARVGKGLLIATSLDHTEDAGRYLMQRLLEWAVGDGATCRGELDPALVRSWTVEAAGH